MNRTLKASIAAVLLGTATLSIAQTPSESFADRIRQFQALSSGAGTAFKPQPTFSNAPKAPAPRLSIEEFQAMSSDSLAFAPVDGWVVGNQAIARTRPAWIPHIRPTQTN